MRLLLVFIYQRVHIQVSEHEQIIIEVSFPVE